MWRLLWASWQFPVVAATTNGFVCFIVAVLCILQGRGPVLLNLAIIAVSYLALAIALEGGPDGRS